MIQIKVKYQRMQNNYDRLFLELAELIDDRQVYQSLDDNLKIRVDSLLGINYNDSPNQTIKELSCNDTQTLFDSSPKEPSTEGIVLKETNSNHAKKKHTLNSSGRITAKKIETSAFDDEKKTPKIKNNSKLLVNNKNRSKSTKDLVRYNMQTSKSKSKSKSKEKSVKGSIQCPSKKNIGSKSEMPLQKSIQKISIIDKSGKQNRNCHQEKKFSKDFKKTSKTSTNFTNEPKNLLVQPKLKTTNSNLHQSRQIIKKLATMQTEPSRTSLSSNKAQVMKQKKSVKIPEKQLTIMEAINKKQDILNYERLELQNEIREFQQMIEYQRCRLDATNTNITKINLQIAKKEVGERESSQDFKISRKKSEHFISQSRQMQNRIAEVNKSRDTINASIEEEKYLINMYLTVIEQIKSQLKIQQSQKIDLIKKLVVIKNTEKMSMEKYLSKEALSDQLFRGMNQSMKKWM